MLIRLQRRTSGVERQNGRRQNISFEIVMGASVLPILMALIRPTARRIHPLANNQIQILDVSDSSYDRFR